jgi:hypothetical protein
MRAFARIRFIRFPSAGLSCDNNSPDYSRISSLCQEFWSQLCYPTETELNLSDKNFIDYP